MIKNPAIRRLTIFPIFAIFLFGCMVYGYHSQPQTLSESKQPVGSETLHPDSVGIYPIHIPSDLDLITYETSITLDSTKKAHFLLFPSGGTRTDVFVFDKKPWEASSEKRIPLASSGGPSGEKILVDISGIPKGDYWVQYTSCGNGGMIRLTLQ